MLKFDTLLKLRGFPINKAQEIVKDIPSMEHILEWQNGKKWEIFDFHFRNNTFYHSFIKTKPKNWEDIPIITKKELRIDTSINKYDISKRMYIRNTSGSTGNPFTYALDYVSHALTWLLIKDRYQGLSISLNDYQARFYGLPIGFKERWKERIKDWGSNRYRFSLLDLSDKEFEKWIDIFRKNKFQYIYGYSFPIISFSKYLLKKGIVLKDYCPSLKGVIVTAEMCPHEEQQIIKKATGVKVANEYGASEIGIIGFGTSDQWKISDELIYIEIVDENGNLLPDGELGRIICTPLFNKGTPFIRYDVGDLGAIENTPNGKVLTKLEGRREELMKTPLGKKLPGDTFFYYIMKDFSKQVPHIEEYRVIQKNLSHCEMLVTSKQDIGHKREKHLQNMINNRLKEDISIKIKQVHTIERSRMGKFRRFISEIN